MENLDLQTFEMYTKAGDKACRSIVRAAWKKIEGKKRGTGVELRDYVEARMNKVYMAGKHKEIYDTEPRYHILYLVNKKAKEFNYDFGKYFGY